MIKTFIKMDNFRKILTSFLKNFHLNIFILGNIFSTGFSNQSNKIRECSFAGSNQKV